MNPYLCVFRMGIEKALEYRTGFVLSMLSAAFPILIQTSMWNYLYANADAARIMGYSHEQILIYTLLATLVSQLVSAGFEWEVNSDIKNGGLNKYLVRPVAYRNYCLSSVMGQKVPRLFVVGPAMVFMIAFGILVLKLPLSAARVVVFLCSLFLAFVLNFFLFYCVALLGFWLTDVDKLFGTVSIVLTVLSGGVFPMDIFGSALAGIFRLLPFGYTTQFCVNIINGRYGGEQIGWGLLCQTGWIVALAGLERILWRQGLRRYVAVGG